MVYGTDRYFAFVDKLSGNPGNVSVLFSPAVYLDEYPQYCLQFW